MALPRDPALDSTLDLLAEGYPFIWNHCQRLGSDAFRARILGRRALCVHGPAAAALFYDERRVQRFGAVPRRVQTSLFGKHAVHTLDEAPHRWRKAAFLSLMSPARLEELAGLAAGAWRDAVRRREADGGPMVLFDAAAQVLTRAVCAWAGVPLAEAEVPRRARALVEMVDAFGGVGPRLWRGKQARMRAEFWALRLVRDVRAGLRAPEGSALETMAHLTLASGGLLDERTAAVELLNVLRPTVAIAWYVAFAALALHQHPGERERLAQDGDGASTERFVQEVRRFYPFTPFLAGRARAAFAWQGEEVQPGTLVLLDVWGALHDPRSWDEPMVFRPERFRGLSRGAYDFIPQGGGAHASGHRCPGEWITLQQLALAVHVLTRCVRYEVAPGQDLGYDLARMPTRPRSGVVLRDLHATAALDAPMPRVPSPEAARGAAEALASLPPGLRAAPDHAGAATT